VYAADQLADRGTQRRRIAHDSLAEARQMSRHLGLEREQMPDLHILGACGLHATDQVGIRTRLRTVFDARKKGWFHSKSRSMLQQSHSDPVAAYDRVAPVFARLAQQRKPYLDRIEQLVLSEIPSGSCSMLDVGSGDGARARRIAQARGIEELVLLEPSRAMLGSVAANAKVWTMRAEELHSVQAEFDVITCLWNVLGHIFPASARIEALRQFARLVSPHGRIFADVNHRYNARQYGSLQTVVRFIRDQASWDEKNGDVAVTWEVDSKECTTRGHVFTDKEFRSLSFGAGLRIEKTFIVDYATGELRRWRWKGNLLYVLRPASAETA
jgi:SAM-dependent methyltransferase